ncbi:hypothetical protein ACJIZ3_024462 [Penstemon smallii]|uniref:E2 ubiquitin-conjugating enzyme n=1 Tax=Penstemon smallii TaxID=265156 RepID=A0ABD3TRX9_9LAMI
MAQAARQNLRMQKELKLLLTGPPPGASFPSLSDSSSLTSIDADFQGPEGTVYANGVFKIKIQIPERYPFQPPIVTFATPIYHPNIDNGGRICLDILNLPPKGSWQPSLNISTVLTSIGLLLSEPNPDDGLMHDASREYKYNRQTFDQKARSMTEKYAKAGESKSVVSSHNIQTHSCPSTSQTDTKGSDAPNFCTGHSVCNTRFSGSSKKLSLESLGSSSNCDSGKGIYKVPNNDHSKNQTEAGQVKEAKTIVTEYNRSPTKLQATKHEMSTGGSINTNMPNHFSSLSETENPCVGSPESLPSVQVSNNDKQVPTQDKDYMERSCSLSIHQAQSLESVSQRSRDSTEKLHPVPSHDRTDPNNGAIERSRSGSTSIRRKKLGLVGLRRSHQPQHEKENLAPIQCLLFKPSDPSAASPIKSPIVSENGMYHNFQRIGKQTLNVAKKLPLKPQDQLPISNNHVNLHSDNRSSTRSKFMHVRTDARLNEVRDKESTCKLEQPSGGSPIHESTIVLDSEDSEDDNVPVRSKLSLTRKCLSKKRKSNIR